jgi:hypothetical protein
MGRRTLLLIASILVAAVGTGLVALYVRTADRRAQAGEESVTILVANQDIPVGSTAATISGFVEEEPYPTRLVKHMKDPVSDLAKIPSGQSTVATIPAGLPLLLSQFGASGDSVAAAIPGVDPDKTIFTLVVDNPAILTSYVRKGTAVMVWVGTGASKKELLFPNVRVSDPPVLGSGTISIQLTIDQLADVNRRRQSVFSVYPVNSNLGTPSPESINTQTAASP